MKTKVERYKSADEFGKSLGLSLLEMELIRQTKRSYRDARSRILLLRDEVAQAEH